MKIRKGFVSNSSSSSFVCDVCGHEISGWDISLSDNEMYECENGHIFCGDEMIQPSFEEKKKWFISNCDSLIEKYTRWNETYPNDKVSQDASIKEYTELKEQVSGDISEADFVVLIEEALEDEGNYEYPSCFCPICSMDNFKDAELTEYLKIKFDVNMDELISEIKDKFDNYGEFQKHLQGKTDED